MQSSPLVSIIMPTYNSAKYIGPAIQSALDQSYTNWELLIFNDGSTDNTDEIVAPFLTDSRIQYVKQEKGGVSAARNYSMSLAQSGFIAFLDADDMWLPTKLEKQMRIFTEFPEVDVCACNYDVIFPDGHIQQTSKGDFFLGVPLPGLVSGKLTVPLSSAIIRKKVYDTIGGFDEAITSLSEDYEFWLRASVSSIFCKLDEKLVLYRTGHENASSAVADKRRDIVLHDILPRFLKEHGGSKYVKWYHVWKQHADCYFGRASSAKDWKSK